MANTLKITMGLWYLHKLIASQVLPLQSFSSHSLNLLCAQGIAKHVAKLKKSKTAADQPVIIVGFISFLLQKPRYSDLIPKEYILS